MFTTIYRAALAAGLIFLLQCSIPETVHSQGRFLRGETWKEYSIPGTRADFYVSPTGSDSWSGKLPMPNAGKTDGPFATLKKAQEAVRHLKQSVYKPKKAALDKRYIGSPHPFGTGRDILVLLRGGIYSPDSTLVFNAADGGERVETELPTGAFEYHQLKDYYVTWASYPGETAIISGGEKIRGWTRTSGGKWQVQLATGNIQELFAGGKRQTLARIPNSGYFETDGQPTDPGSFRFRKGDLQNWKDLSTNRLTMTVRWGAIHSSLVSVDEKHRVATLAKPDNELLNVPPRYFVENMESLLDTAGEWFFDRNTRVLSFIPGDNNPNADEANVMIPRLGGLVKVAGTRENPVRNLRLYRLTFSTTRPGDRATLDLTYTKNCEITGNTLENVSQTAISLGTGCYHNLVSANIIRNNNGGGISVSGSPIPDKWADLVSDNEVSRNEISNLRPAVVGIRTANALRTHVYRNWISNTGSYGITAGSWPNVEETSDGNHLVEYNHVSFTNMARDDEGAIAVYGLSPGSIVRDNLIHDVRPATTNENVGLFFQNMASGFSVTNNILYGLKQAEMKLCAAYLENNVYSGNNLIERPLNEPEKILSGDPLYRYSQLQINGGEKPVTGAVISLQADIENTGASGNREVALYVDGREVSSQLFPVIRRNHRTIIFRYQFLEPGKHRVAIGTTPEMEIVVTGEPVHVLCSNLSTDSSLLPEGDSLTVSAEIVNTLQQPLKQPVSLVMDGKVVLSKELQLSPEEKILASFRVLPPAGTHLFSIGNMAPIQVRVFPVREVNLRNSDWKTYCSPTAGSCRFQFGKAIQGWSVSAAGTDFLHAEDSYGTIYLPAAVSGNFVATVKIVKTGEAVSDWFRFGLFARNNLNKSNHTGKELAGSVLVFSTPKRHGMQWDEFGDGSMHNSRSFNYTTEKPLPVWLRLVRHGNSFSGYYSFDGKQWVLSRESGPVAELGNTLDLGMAAGSNDQKPSEVWFEDFRLWVEDSAVKLVP